MNAFEVIEFSDLIRYAMALVVVFAALIAILYTIWWGFLMILSGGKEEKVKWAVNHIRHALIGIIFIVLVLFVVPIISGLLNLPYGEYAKPAQVFQTISDISNHVFGNSSDSELISPENSGTLPTNFSDL